jgi:hypothetical protein
MPPGPNSMDWIAHKDTIQTLYLEEDRKLLGPEGVMEVMLNRHQFSATYVLRFHLIGVDGILTVFRKSQYETMFRKWGFRKNMKKEDWQAISKLYNEQREANAKVIYKGKEISQQKLKKELRRYSRNSVIECPSRSISLRVDSDQSLPNHDLAQTGQPNLPDTSQWEVIANFAGRLA